MSRMVHQVNFDQTPICKKNLKMMRRLLQKNNINTKQQGILHPVRIGLMEMV
jgi:hypothetical protein